MKNLFKSMMAIAVAAMSFTACSTDVTEDIAPVEKFTVKINAVSPESRTVFGDIDGSKYPTLWVGNEKILASLNCYKYSNISSAVSPESVSPNKETATFEVSLTAGDNPAEGYVIDAICPASAWVSGVNTSFTWNLEIPATQTPTEKSCDPAAQILVGQSATTTTLPTSVDMVFKHMTAYAKFSLNGLTLDSSNKVKSVVIESNSVNIAGRHKYSVRDNGNNKVGDITLDSGKGSKTIIINTSSLANIWVALAPVDVSGTDLTFTVNTLMGSYSRTVTMPANRQFESGKVSVFTVDMSTAEFTSLPKINTIEKDNTYTVVGTVVAVGTKAYILADETGAIMVYGSGHGRSLMEKVIVTGTASRYQGYNTNGLQIAASSTEVLSENNSWTYNPTILSNANLESLVGNTATCTEVQFSGNLVKSGDYINIAIEGCAKQGSLNYVNTANYSEFNGKAVTVKGYITGTYNYLNVLPYSVTAIDNAPAWMTINKASIIAEAAAGTYTERGVYSLYNAEDSAVSVTYDNTVITGATVSGGAITYTITGNSSDAIRNTGWIKLTVGSKEYEITFSQKKPAAANAVTTSITFADIYTENTPVNGLTINVDSNISLVFNKANASTAPQYYKSNKAVRMYQNGSTLDVTASNGKTISSIEFTFADNQYYLGSDSGNLSAEGSVRTWSGSASSVKFTTTGTTSTTRAYITKIVISYE